MASNGVSEWPADCGLYASLSANTGHLYTLATTKLHAKTTLPKLSTSLQAITALATATLNP